MLSIRHYDITSQAADISAEMLNEHSLMIPIFELINARVPILIK